MYYTRIIHSSHVTATLPAPDLIIFSIFTRNEYRKKAKKVCDLGLWVFYCVFGLGFFSAGWNPSTASEKGPSHTLHFGNTAPSEPPWGGQFQESPSMKLPKGMSQTPEVPATQLGLQLQLCPAELKKSAILGT